MFNVVKITAKKKMSSCLEKTEIIIQIIIQILTLSLAVLAACSDICSLWRNRQYETAGHNKELNWNHRQVRKQTTREQTDQLGSSQLRRRSSLPALPLENITCGPSLLSSTPLKSITPTLSTLEDSSIVRLDLSREAI